jgi:hypothetical protein
MGFGFGTHWALLYALDHSLFTLPYSLLPAMLFMKGIAEVLPRPWIRTAAILRLASLVAGVIGVVWLTLRFSGWLPR